MTFAGTWWRAAAIVALAPGITILTPACGGADEAAAPKPAGRPVTAPPAAKTPVPSLDVCALLTQAEVEAALGTPVGDPVRGDVPPVLSCSRIAAGRLDNVTITVTVHDDARQAYDSWVMALTVNRYPEIAGLGDRAYRSPVSDVTVLKGRYEVSVDVSQSISKDAQVRKATDLAGRALGRLPQ